MNDKELADKVVALGVGNLIAAGNYQIGESTGLYAKQFVRDWRVAGALMERCQPTMALDINPENPPWILIHTDIGKTYEGEDDSLPRAIIEACVEALDD